MTQVVLLRHGGARCALPASQVLRIEAPIEGAEERLYLFGDRSVDETPPAGGRRLLVRTPQGERVVFSEGAVLGTLGEETLFALPTLLRDAFALPHVVGLADTSEGIVWLIDLFATENETDER